MVSSFTTNKRLEKPANNDDINTWDVPVNADWDIIDNALGGQVTISVALASGNVLLATNQYQPLIIKFSGLLTANVTYQVPTGIGGQWVLQNVTTGAFTLTFASQGGGRSATIPAGVSYATCDGLNADIPIALPAPLYVSGGNFGVGASSPAAFMEVRKDQAAATDLMISNLSTGAPVSARAYFRTGTVNSDTYIQLVDNAGAPYLLTRAASAVMASYHDFPLHVFRNSTGTEKMRLDMSSGALIFTADGLSLTGTATASNFWANNAGKILSTDRVWAAAAPVSIAYAATVTLDFSTFINGYITLTGNLTISTTNPKPGQSGWVDFIQDGTGSRTLSYTAGKFSSTGTLPSIASAAAARTRLFYCIDENNRTFFSGSSSALVNN